MECMTSDNATEINSPKESSLSTGELSTFLDCVHFRATEWTDNTAKPVIRDRGLLQVLGSIHGLRYKEMTLDHLQYITRPVGLNSKT